MPRLTKKKLTKKREKDYNKAYYKENKDELTTVQSKRYAADPSKKFEAQRKGYEADPSKKCEAQRKGYEADPSKKCEA